MKPKETYRWQVQLSAEQQRELQDTCDHHPKPYVRERSAAILLMAQGKSPHWVAIHGVLKPGGGTSRRPLGHRGGQPRVRRAMAALADHSWGGRLPWPALLGVDRAEADNEVFGDLSVGQSRGEQAQYLHLSGRQSGRIAVRPGHVSCPGLVSEELRHHQRLWDCQRLLWGHRLPLCPKDGEGLFTQVGTYFSHSGVIGSSRP